VSVSAVEFGVTGAASEIQLRGLVKSFRGPSGAIQAVPSYWLVQASHVALGGHPWPARAWAVIAAWTVLLSLLAVRAYRRDTGRM
jgi:hypothetical protein